MLLTATERLTMNTRPKNPANARNLNFCGIGSSGSGKTRFWLTPQLLQAHSSYVVVDPKGSVLGQVGAFLQRRGYQIKVFNSIDFSKSMHYNPLSYIRNEADILKFVNALITNTKGEGKEGDPFWTKAETLLYCALIAYIIFEGPAEDRNMNTLVDMISGMEVKEDDENYKNAVDYMFDGLAKRKPDCFAVKQYRKFKLSSGKTAKSILISCGARLAPFDIPQLREIMSYDELELDRMGDRRTATFFCISDTDSTYNFLVALAFSQMFNLLCERADNVHGGRLPHHVRVLWDEAANTGQVPQLEKLVAVIRSREISLCLLYQQLAQCKAIYDKNAETILGNMDSVLFLGGREASTIKEISENWLGKATISMLEKLVAVIRSREISLCLLYQQLAQCKAIYDKNAETILGNMDSVLFLGGRESSTIKEISENWLGKATISMQTEGRSRGQSESYSQNTQRLGRELMTPSELATMPGDRCILQLRGLPPFYSKKYDLKQHPNYKYTAEADKVKNAFDLNSLVTRRMDKLNPNETYTVYKVDVPDEALTGEDEDILNYDDLDDPDAFV
jgi:type IV secretory pathway TraG/TraD family ATPase VirD4